MFQFVVSLFIFTCLVQVASFHGMLLDPVNRSSRWRFDPLAPVDYNDNEGFCGGFYNQWVIHDGKCGLCGDDYGLPAPRPHEYGGLYGNGTIVKEYAMNSTLSVGVLITANHRGYFLFDLCNMDDDHENEDCFRQYQLNLTTGENRFSVKTTNRGWFNTTLALPENVICDHCILRWTYITGNSWGKCANDTYAVGCGPQENFRSCSDIAILPNAVQLDNGVENIPEDPPAEN
ncbi:unnamed protein product [Hermetia illucens]|uniref:Chitin-binding type-4 domain-containing protein n=2 Tax=Hermetia illucens TaxID=343691 RepID=A0A7R8V5M2_HERIL|nr:unnamed protein product [Hermetia illucens]CAD7093331.1 unnamed protein product [Hermetia illucens]